MNAYGVKAYRACATSAMREASNGKELIEATAEKAGVSIDLINGKEEATLLDIYEAIEGKFIPKNCLFSSKKINSCCCIMKPLLSSINNIFVDFMSSHKINNIKL